MLQNEVEAFIEDIFINEATIHKKNSLDISNLKVCLKVNLKNDWTDFIKNEQSIYNEKFYPYYTSPLLIKIFLDYLKNKGLQKITVLNILYKNIKKLDEQNFIKVKNSKQYAHKLYSQFYLPEEWINADIRICLANVNVHKHHFNKQIRSIQTDIVSMSFITKKVPYKMNKNKFLSLIELDLEHYIRDLFNAIQSYPFYSFIDARKILKTNEHSFFRSVINHNFITYGTNSKMLEKKLKNQLQF